MPPTLINQTQFLTGTEAASYYATDAATAVSVAHALFGELNWREVQSFGTLAGEGRAIAVELDKQELSSGTVAPKRGGKIVRAADSSEWRIMSVQFDAVIGVFRCLCSEAR